VLQVVIFGAAEDVEGNAIAFCVEKVEEELGMLGG